MNKQSRNGMSFIPVGFGLTSARARLAVGKQFFLALKNSLDKVGGSTDVGADPAGGNAFNDL